MIDLAQEEDRVRRIKLEIDSARKLFENEQAALKKASERLACAREAQEILQVIAQTIQQHAHQKISQVVSSCLSAVFDDPYEFKIDFERKRGRTEARLRFVRGSLEVDPMTASGGGMVDVAAFALRVACVVLHRPRLSQLVVLDEPFRFVSTQYRDNIREMLEQLAQELKIQIVMVTHIEEIATGKVINL